MPSFSLHGSAHGSFVISDRFEPTLGTKTSFSDIVEARRFLQRASVHAGVRTALRALAGRLLFHSLREMSDAALFELLARLLVQGRLVVQVRNPVHVTSFETFEEAVVGREPEVERLSAPPVVVHWVEFQLVDDDDVPLAGEPFRAELADGRVVRGSLDGSGCIRFSDIPIAGQCTIRFPEIDGVMQPSSSDDEIPAPESPPGSNAKSTLYRAGKPPPKAPTDRTHRFRLPGWTPIRALADDSPPPSAPFVVDVPAPLMADAEDDIDQWEPIGAFLEERDEAISHELALDHWIAVRLVGEDGSPIASARCRLVLPNGDVRDALLDAEGTLRVDGVREGLCKVSFPDLDIDAVELLATPSSRVEAAAE